MIRCVTSIGNVSLVVETDAPLHPEVFESLLTQLSIKAVIVHEQVTQESSRGVAVVDETE